MNALTFSLKTTAPTAIDCSPLVPDRLAGLSIANILALRLDTSRDTMRVDELFILSGEDTSQLQFNGPTEKLDYLGAGMTTGTIHIAGNAGDYLGFQMRAGKLICHGNSGDFAACSMRGGELTIYGQAGDFLGAGTDGARKGMLGGVVIVKGNAGDRVGDQMRRGLILIEGDVGAFCGSRMIAGTIGVLGKVGKHVGFNMHRGTILLRQHPQCPITMQDCGEHTLPFLTLWFKSLASLDTAFNPLQQNRVRRFVGDAACSGNGEILVIDM